MGRRGPAPEPAASKLARETKDQLNKMLSYHTGQTVKKVEQDTERDNFMDAKEAMNYGLIDKVITQIPA